MPMAGPGVSDLAHESSINVFVGGLSPDTQEDHVREAFAAAAGNGVLLSVQLSRWASNGQCKGYGYVRFSDVKVARQACSAVKEVGSCVGGMLCPRLGLRCLNVLRPRLLLVLRPCCLALLS
jgi:RNA recognition motif-containing protein